MNSLPNIASRQALVWSHRKLFICSLLLALAGGMHRPAHAQLRIADSGSPSYTVPVTVPPGIAGMSPNLGLLYGASGLNGSVGHGWSIQGVSAITRCPGSKLVDGFVRNVDYSVNDKLCLDGQRLIQTTAAGGVTNGRVVKPGRDNPFQQGDSAGGVDLVLEYRTEKDIYARIRSYGAAAGNGANGPAYFKVWTKSGQVYEYGVNANTTSNAQITAAAPRQTVVAWPVSRISDTAGNYIDFQYAQRDVAWGSGPAGSPTPGHEWNLIEVRYTGNGAQQPTNKVVFSYSDRPDRPNAAQDRGETYHQGSKNVSVRRLDSIRTFINWPASQPSQPAGAVKVKTIKLGYDNGPVSGRSRLKSIVECAGAAEDKCLPATTFNYSAGAGAGYIRSAAFKSGSLGLATLQGARGDYGVLTGDFTGHGRSDILRWGIDAANNALYLSTGDGNFSRSASFNLAGQRLFSGDGCYSALAADFNGDGLTDILRTMQPTTAARASCGTVQNLLFRSNGDGSFMTINVSNVDFSVRTSTSTTQYNCVLPRSSKYVANCKEPGDTYLGTSITRGQNYHFADVDNDGLIDVITTVMPSYFTTERLPSEAVRCADQVCTSIYRGLPGGGFSDPIPTNLAHHSVYAAPPARYESVKRFPYVADINGDGLSDLLVDTGRWISRGDGNFDNDPAAPYSAGCVNALDFNGDGRSDCIYSSVPGVASSQAMWVGDGTYTVRTASNFNLTAAGTELENYTNGSWTGGMAVADIDGDGRSDIVHWADDAAQNAVYLSNGDGTFRGADFNFNSSIDQLQKSDGSVSFMTGDFTGHGNTEILRIVSNLNGGDEGGYNALYVKRDPTPPDQLQSVVSSTGLTTALTWVPLSNAASGALGERYTSDRGTAQAATYPVTDLTLPMYVVATVTADSGAGGQLRTEYSYSGLKSAHDGQGWLGFRETRHQNQAPNGDNLTVYTRNLQTGAYVGMAAVTETRLGTLNSNNAMVLSRSTFIYCDGTAADGAKATATADSPCVASARLQRPYLYQSKEEGADLNGAALPTVTTTNTFNDDGDPTQIDVSTTGTALGLAQTFTKATTNQYKPVDPLDGKWLLGRLSQSRVVNTVPYSLGNIVTSANGAVNGPVSSPAPGAGAVTPLPTAVLSTILSLLLDD